MSVLLLARGARSGDVLAVAAAAALALAIAFISVSIGLGAFALAYRATLLRSAADRAANTVPLDVTVAAGPDFTTPLEVVPAARWESLAGGSVWSVRRTDASFISGGSSVAVPALGVPAGALTQLRGWRPSDGSASMAVLQRRLVPPGRVRVPGPQLPADARALALKVLSPGVAVTVTADLRDSGGSIRRVVLGQAGARTPTIRARLPRADGPLELDGSS